jgi:hypothetical protein
LKATILTESYYERKLDGMLFDDLFSSVYAIEEEKDKVIAFAIEEKDKAVEAKKGNFAQFSPGVIQPMEIYG